MRPRSSIHFQGPSKLQLSSTIVAIIADIVPLTVFFHLLAFLVLVTWSWILLHWLPTLRLLRALVMICIQVLSSSMTVV